MKELDLKCICCAGATPVNVELTQEFEHFACAECGYEHFRPTGRSIHAEMYEHDPDYSDDLALSGNFRDLIQWPHLRALAILLDRKIPSGLRTLDVGCFNGFFVKAMLERGFDAYGVDFNQQAVEFGLREYALNGRLWLRKIEDLAEIRECYDVVTCFELIEHLDDPGALVHSLARMLNTGGLLVISTPNSRMCWRPQLDYPPHHLSRFTPLSLDLLLRRSGLEVLTHEEQMSCVDLARHFVGTMFRSGSRKSLRGGEFRSKLLANAARKTLNKFRPVLTAASAPFDHMLYRVGLRYIAQLAIAEKAMLPRDRQSPPTS